MFKSFIAFVFFAAINVRASSSLEARQSALPTGWVSIGCYTDDTASRTLKIAATSDITGMTVEECLTFCTPAGYQFAGVEFGRECYCDNIIESPGAPATDGCIMPCTGNSAEICGGSNRINIFNNTAVSHAPPPPPPPPPPAATIKQSVGTFQYKGCFQDGVNGATRSLLTQLSVTGGVDAETCTAACKAAGFPLAGLEYGQECWCDAFMPYVVASPDSDCNMPCQADPTEICGAGNRLAVYQDTTAPPPNPTACLTNAQLNNPSLPYKFDLQAVPNPGGGVGMQVGIFNLGVDKFQGPQALYLLSVQDVAVTTQHIFNFAVNTFWPNSLGFGIPAALLLPNASAQYFWSLPGSNIAPNRQYCAMPNPIGHFGPFIGPATLAANGHNNLWGLCATSTTTPALVYNPDLTGSPPASCQFVVLEMRPPN